MVKFDKGINIFLPVSMEFSTRPIVLADFPLDESGFGDVLSSPKLNFSMVVSC